MNEFEILNVININHVTAIFENTQTIIDHAMTKPKLFVTTRSTRTRSIISH